MKGIKYRLAIENYNDKYEVIKAYINQTPQYLERLKKTVYDDEGYSYIADIKTGEILGEKSNHAIKKSVDDSISRTKKIIKDYVACNDFSYFVTLTFNKELQDRYNDKQVKKHFTRFRRYLRRNFSNIYYVCVPERHKDNALHFHLLIGGCTLKELNAVNSGHFTKGTKKPIYNILGWKYGHSDLTIIEDLEKTGSYILKYIGKDFGVTEDFKKRYWTSRNLNKPKKRVRDFLLNTAISIKSFVNIFVRDIKDYDLTFSNKYLMMLKRKTHDNIRKLMFNFGMMYNNFVDKKQASRTKNICIDVNKMCIIN
jgi:hypothetical protein